MSPIQQCRDRFLEAIFAKFPSLDRAEIYEILCLLKQPFKALAEADTQFGPAVKVKEPWTFDLVRDVAATDLESQPGGFGQRSDANMESLQVSAQPSIPDMNRLSLEEKTKEGGPAGTIGPGGLSVSRIETDDQHIYSTVETSEMHTRREPGTAVQGAHCLNSEHSAFAGEEEEKHGLGGKNEKHPLPELGRLSHSESNQAATKNFVSPQFDKRSSRTKHELRNFEDAADEGMREDENILEEEDSARHHANFMG